MECSAPKLLKNITGVVMPQKGTRWVGSVVCGGVVTTLRSEPRHYKTQAGTWLGCAEGHPYDGVAGKGTPW